MWSNVHPTNDYHQQQQHNENDQTITIAFSKWFLPFANCRSLIMMEWYWCCTWLHWLLLIMDGNGTLFLYPTSASAAIRLWFERECRIRACMRTRRVCIYIECWMFRSVLPMWNQREIQPNYYCTFQVISTAILYSTPLFIVPAIVRMPWTRPSQIITTVRRCHLQHLINFGTFSTVHGVLSFALPRAPTRCLPGGLSLCLALFHGLITLHSRRLRSFINRRRGSWKRFLLAIFSLFNAINSSFSSISKNQYQYLPFG